MVHLASGKFDSSLADFGVVAILELRNEGLDIGGTSGSVQRVIRQVLHALSEW